MDPYPIWGDGQQERDFTFVEDIVEGMINASQKIFDGTPINLGTGRRYKITDVADIIFNIIGWRPSKLKYEKSMPVGPLSRALDITRAKKLLKWEPRVSLKEGLQRTIKWYADQERVKWIVKKEFLLERT
jgi:UDP-glucose 4-epimerase